jgi:hypothetical protein
MATKEASLAPEEVIAGAARRDAVSYALKLRD